MKCPSCNENLAMTERLGIEIDYCPKCRGVWLDRGELDKIIEKSTAQTEQDKGSQNQNAQHQNYNPYYEEGGYGGGHHGAHGGRDRHRRKGFLGNLFDF